MVQWHRSGLAGDALQAARRQTADGRRHRRSIGVTFYSSPNMMAALLQIRQHAAKIEQSSLATIVSLGTASEAAAELTKCLQAPIDLLISIAV